MKTITHISWLIALFASLQITASHAQTSYEPITQQITLHVERAGTLPLMIDDIQKYLITNLKLSGELNGTDILMLREMASGWHLLEKLDLSDAEIIEGASPYYEDKSSGTSYTTSTWTISPYMFYHCDRLKSIKLPKTTKKICQYAFSECEQLSDIEIPEGVTEILEYAFKNCASLTNVNIPEGVTSLGQAFYGCTSLSNVDIPGSVTNLGYAFYGCTSLTSVNFLGKSPLYLDGGGFSSTFEDCPNLQAIRFFSPTPLNPYVYPKISNDVIVYIPKGSMSAYSATRWGDYNLVEFDATDIDTPIRTDKAGAREHYSIDGKRLTAPQRGLNIIREADGTTKKILIQ